MESERFVGLFGARVDCRSHGAEPPRFFYTRDRFSLVDPKKKPPGDQSEDDEQLYVVRIIDNDYNTYQQVMDITMIALGINEEEAFAVAWEVDHRGFSVVARGPLGEAQAIARVIRTIGIEVQVNPVDETGFEH